jgi:hypothetical protein
MEAKRQALDEIAVRQDAADVKRKEEGERQQQVAPDVGQWHKCGRLVGDGRRCFTKVCLGLLHGPPLNDIQAKDRTRSMCRDG